jgi:hypothetical protein
MASTILNIPISEKLNRGNFLVWQAQVLPAVRGSRLMAILDGSLAQPSSTIRVKKVDQSEEEVQNPAHIT